MIGGIGDLFLSMEKAIDEGECAVYSHFGGAKKFVESFGVKVPKFVEFNSVANMPAPAEPYIGHDEYPDLPIIKSRNLLNSKGKPIVGIHPFGSKLSNNFWKKQKQPSKYITQENIALLVNSLKHKYDLRIFGSKVDLCSFYIPDAYNVYVDIEDLPSAVSECSVVVATDSAIKTISAAMKIPTAVVIGNYPDPMRDAKFLMPYMKAGIMKVGAYDHGQDSKLFKEIANWINSM